MFTDKYDTAIKTRYGNAQLQISMKKNSDEPITYESAWAELQAIVRELQAETVSVDELSEKIERATTLSNFCRERLRKTEEQLEKLAKE